MQTHLNNTEQKITEREETVSDKPRPKNIAVIDLGSNSIRMIIVRIRENGGTSLLNQVKHMVQLGQGAFLHNNLQEDAMNRTMEVLVSFAEACKSYQVEEILAIATAAVRDAQNGQAFLEEIAEATGIDFTCISGKEEARLIYLGVSEEFEKNPTMRFFLDIGGGSTEFIVGDSYFHRELDSVKMGCVRLANMFTSENKGVVSEELYAKMQAYVRSLTAHTFSRMHAYFPSEMIASSGTAQNLALMAAYLEHGEKKPKGAESTLTYKGLCKIVKMLCESSEEERKNIMGINPRRVDVLIPGAAILQTVMEELGFDYLTTSAYGLRDGILKDYVKKNYAPSGLDHVSVQEKSVLKLARVCNFEEAHARHVAKLALRLFDTAKMCDLHNMGREWRNLLYYSAILHDIGIFIAFTNHDDHGKYLISHHNLLGFTQREITIIAGLVATHRMKLNKNMFVFDCLDPHVKENAEKLSIMLKVAEALELSHSRHVDDAVLSVNSENSTKLTIYHSNPCPLEQEKLENGRKILNKFGCICESIQNTDGECLEAKYPDMDCPDVKCLDVEIEWILRKHESI